ncbi:MAG TPA: ATP-binding protein [Puia sp.]|nr:ATP-binding protein [Puia sp.]
MPLKKIVIIGPESTGKSTLCEGLAAHFHADWVPEFAREYLLEHGMDYKYEDLLTIAGGQIALEDERAAALIRRAGIAPANPILFVDTDLYVLKVWSEFVFGRCDPWILGQIGSRQYDGYLLCNTDLPWVKDELREYPDLVTREKLYHIYRDLLVNQPTPWAEISGLADQRLATAIEAVNGLIA